MNMNENMGAREKHQFVVALTYASIGLTRASSCFLMNSFAQK